MVNEKQREEIYKIEDEYQPKIEALQKQLDAPRKERDEKISAVLTAEQKKQLEEAAAKAKNLQIEEPADHQASRTAADDPSSGTIATYHGTSTREIARPQRCTDAYASPVWQTFASVKVPRFFRIQGCLPHCGEKRGLRSAERYHAAATVLDDVDFVLAGEPAEGLHHVVARFIDRLDQFGHSHDAVLSERVHQTTPAVSPIDVTHESVDVVVIWPPRYHDGFWDL